MFRPSVVAMKRDGSAVIVDRLWSYFSIIAWPSVDDDADKSVGPVVGNSSVELLI